MSKAKPIDVTMIPVDQIEPNQWNPNRMTDEEFAELVAEVKHTGQIAKPVVVRRRGRSRNRYEIIDGEHNWRAAKECGLESVPCEIQKLDDFEAMRQTYKRNQHGAHNKTKEGRMFRAMRDNRELSNVKLAQELNLSEGTVRNAIIFADLADVVGPDHEDTVATLKVKEARKLLEAKVPGGCFELFLRAIREDWEYPCIEKRYRNKALLYVPDYCNQYGWEIILDGRENWPSGMAPRISRLAALLTYGHDEVVHKLIEADVDVDLAKDILGYLPVDGDEKLLVTPDEVLVVASEVSKLDGRKRDQAIERWAENIKAARCRPDEGTIADSTRERAIEENYPQEIKTLAKKIESYELHKLMEMHDGNDEELPAILEQMTSGQASDVREAKSQVRREQHRIEANKERSEFRADLNNFVEVIVGEMASTLEGDGFEGTVRNWLSEMPEPAVKLIGALFISKKSNWEWEGPRMNPVAEWALAMGLMQEDEDPTAGIAEARLRQMEENIRRLCGGAA